MMVVSLVIEGALYTYVCSRTQGRVGNPKYTYVMMVVSLTIEEALYTYTILGHGARYAIRDTPM